MATDRPRETKLGDQSLVCYKDRVRHVRWVRSVVQVVAAFAVLVIIFVFLDGWETIAALALLAIVMPVRRRWLFKRGHPKTL